MEFLSALALVLLTLVGYSMGAVLGARDKEPTPRLLDLIVIVVLWILALISRPIFGKWLAIGVWLVVAGAVSFVLSNARRHSMQSKAEHAGTTSQEASFMRRLWEGWKSFAAEMGNYQGRLLLVIFYFVVVTPFGVIVRLFSDPLKTKSIHSSSFWQNQSETSSDIEEARRQF